MSPPPPPSPPTLVYLIELCPGREQRCRIVGTAKDTMGKMRSLTFYMTLNISPGSYPIMASGYFHQYDINTFHNMIKRWMTDYLIRFTFKLHIWKWAWPKSGSNNSCSLKILFGWCFTTVSDPHQWAKTQAESTYWSRVQMRFHKDPNKWTLQGTEPWVYSGVNVSDFYPLLLKMSLVRSPQVVSV